ncbi:tripartite tricarboxylate transporter substrate binding protein [Roseococcus sp. SYP-B2431]|uniref:Bug family tripartite tricarboxylate transporter substrate binding protein n=1 Tax=Roseococcus sp. SYP-B2431 TaxID=2496640 RepID=UPI00103E5B26|nr:tripartite tricarboxylate transporter substrate binding protein [Roseococcus sp. SYP-B2431]TCH97364.1 tripartite tricarboxylate transporter substrate binding protein [Roseococcus sp. SYP-B2431]
MLRRSLLSLPPALALAASARAQQTYPSRPIRVLIGFAPGGSTDVTARIMSGRLQSLLGQSIVIENRPGAGGNIATEAVSRAAPDGYTLLLGTIGALAINPTLYRDLSFDPQRDLAPISRIGTVLNVLAVRVDRPWRSVAELIAAAKARPDTLTCASSGVGGAGHLANQQLNMLADIRTVHVPYRGGGALQADLVSGKVDYAFTTALNAVPHAENGRLRILAVPDAQRSRLLPEVPTMAESGLPGFEMVDWVALMGPRGLPEPIAKAVGDAIRATLTDPALVAQLAERKVEAQPSTPQELARFLRDETAKWAPIVHASGAVPD